MAILNAGTYSWNGRLPNAEQEWIDNGRNEHYFRDNYGSVDLTFYVGEDKYYTMNIRSDKTDGEPLDIIYEASYNFSIFVDGMFNNWNGLTFDESLRVFTVESPQEIPQKFYNFITQNTIFTAPPQSTFALTYYYKDQVLKAEEVTELPTPLPIPTLDVENSEFVGWFYDPFYTQEANEGDTITEDTAIFAKFDVERLVKISDQDDLDNYEQKPTTETITEPYAIVVAVPNKIFNCTSFSGLSTLEIDDSTATSNEECLIYFTSGETATTLIYDDSVTKWIGGVPTIEANKQYVISIVKNLAVIGGA